MTCAIKGGLSLTHTLLDLRSGRTFTVLRPAVGAP